MILLPGLLFLACLSGVPFVAAVWDLTNVGSADCTLAGIKNVWGVPLSTSNTDPDRFPSQASITILSFQTFFVPFAGPPLL